MHSNKTRGIVFGSALLALASLGLFPSRAGLVEFPAEFQRLVNKKFPGAVPCVPLCNACHKPLSAVRATTTCSASTCWPPARTSQAMRHCWRPLSMPSWRRNLDVDNDGVTDAAELALGDSPAFPNMSVVPFGQRSVRLRRSHRSCAPAVDRLACSPRAWSCSAWRCCAVAAEWPASSNGERRAGGSARENRVF